MPHTLMSYLPKEDILSFEEILRLTRLALAIGITKIRLRGGATNSKRLTLTRKKNSELSGLYDLNITTSGQLLTKKIIEVKKAGLKGI